MYQNSFAEGYAIGRDSNGGNNGNNGYANGYDAWWIIILLIFGWGGFGRNGLGYGNNGGGGAMDGYVLASDFSNIERKIDGVNNGLCDGFYAVNSSFGNLNNTLAQNTAALQQTMCQGFSGINTGMMQQGYENRLAVNNLSSQVASCCCETNQNIERNTTQGVMNTNAIQQQISNCCCDLEKQALQTKYETAQNQCATLQAIDNLGDRMIKYWCDRDYQNLRDENQTLRWEASQAKQNTYLVNQLRPAAIPAFTVPNPYSSYGYNGYSYNNGCCGGNCL